MRMRAKCSITRAPIFIRRSRSVANSAVRVDWSAGSRRARHASARTWRCAERAAPGWRWRCINVPFWLRSANFSDLKNIFLCLHSYLRGATVGRAGVKPKSTSTRRSGLWCEEPDSGAPPRPELPQVPRRNRPQRAQSSRHASSWTGTSTSRRCPPARSIRSSASSRCCPNNRSTRRASIRRRIGGCDHRLYRKPKCCAQAVPLDKIRR